MKRVEERGVLVQAKEQVIILYDPSFPNGPRERSVERLLSHMTSSNADAQVRVTKADEIGEVLARYLPRILVTLHGEYFPRSMWLPFLESLKKGGQWVHLGGMPFRRPTWKGQNSEWMAGTVQSRYHRTLGIISGYPIDMHSVSGFVSPDETPVLSECAKDFEAREITAFSVRLSSVIDEPAEIGSSGPTDGEIRPLLLAVDSENRPLASPIELIDHFRGDFAGSRWVLGSHVSMPEFESSDAWCRLVQTLVRVAAEGPSSLKVRPGLACYEAGSIPTLSLRFERFPRPGGARREYRLAMRVVKDGEVTCEQSHEIVATGSVVTAEIPLHLRVERGLQVVHCSLSDGTSVIARYRTGFWGRDPQLLSRGSNLSMDGDHFRRGGEVYPVVGTTYHAGDVHRKFLFDPNPYVWDRDFRAMKAAGVNMVRTGLWAYWRKVMPTPGLLNEVALKALDAFVHTARTHDIPVIFTLFAFLPEKWEGVHPYLDPLSVSAQKEYVLGVARRYKGVPGLLWDLINEPTFGTSDKLWSTRPTYGPHELAAWRKWLETKYGSIDLLHDAWRTTPADCKDFSEVPLPSENDFHDMHMYQDRNPLPVGDYRHFAQDAFHGWVRDMAGSIREELGAGALVTVGLDEGALKDCPGSNFFALDVDFTCMHTWWINDSLLWDYLVSKVPGKANLIEETGVMFSERVQGLPRRSEADCRDLLERKFVYTFATGSAGVIEWIWNTNLCMDSNNEVEVGSLRADFTEKPQASILRAIARFISSIRHEIRGRRPEPVWIVIPYSYHFSVKHVHCLQATQKAVLVLHHLNGIPAAFVAEADVGRLVNPPFILVPSPQVLPAPVWEVLLAKARSGATVLITGAASNDEHWRPTGRLSDLGLRTDIRPVACHEPLLLGDEELYFHYSGMKIEHVDKEVVLAAGSHPSDWQVRLNGVGGLAGIVDVPVGAGRVLLCPLPIEMSDNYREVGAVYAAALEAAKVTRIMRLADPEPGVLVRPVEYESAVLYGVVSETDTARQVRFVHEVSGTEVDVCIPGQRAVLILLDRRTGDPIRAYLPEGSALRVAGREVDR
ncbi:MAG: beta-galactosidase [Firmicutes bacterium]|nr:beta-galactosidase [Bacillota bacterium]